VVELPTQSLEDAKQKASASSGVWRLQGMAMPVKFAMANTKDLPASPTTSTPPTTNSTPATPHLLQGPPSRPSTPHTPANSEKAKPAVNQPGSTTPLSKAMSGFSIKSPYQNQPQPYPQNTQIPPAQGEILTVYDTQQQVYSQYVPLMPPVNQPYYPQPYPMIPPPYPQTPSPYQHPQPNYQQPYQPPYQPPPTQNLPTIPEVTQESLTLTQTDMDVLPSQEELDEALKGEDLEYSESDSELLKDDDEAEPDTSTNTSNTTNTTPKI